MMSRKAHLKPDTAKRAREKSHLEKKKEKWRKGNEEEEKRKNKIKDRQQKSRAAAERNRKAGEKWREEIGHGREVERQASMGDRLRGHMALWAKAKEEDRRRRQEEETRKEEETSKKRQVQEALQAYDEAEPGYCRGQWDGRRCQGSRAWTHATLGSP